MLRYVREFFRIFRLFSNDRTNEELGVAEDLTREQRKKYRNQYIGIATTAFLVTAVYLAGVVIGVQGLLVQKNMIYFAIVILLVRDFERLAKEWRYEIDLIQERIYKRSIKNKKQQKKVE